MNYERIQLKIRKAWEYEYKYLTNDDNVKKEDPPKSTVASNETALHKA